MVKRLIKAVVERIPVLARFYRNSRDFLDQRHPPRDTPWGFTFAGHDGMAEGIFEPEETKLMRRLVADVDVLVNIGANVGYYCCHALSMGRSVIAVEPNARNLHYLLKNIQNNNWADQAEIFPIALGSGTNILNMWGGGTGASLVKGWANIPESYVTQVPVLSLDRVLGDAVAGKKALILVDIEGAEYLMLQGAKNILKNGANTIWIMEISAAEHQPRGQTINPYFGETFEIFFSQGYRAFTANEDSIEITPEIVKRVVSGGQVLNCHNFLFRID
ncbi:MAG: FkbM family methyltransferase [Gammaproteobacteria bacterium]|nr:FkbM family methyltransferase [Gammaproteobacteria bacterium]